MIVNGINHGFTMMFTVFRSKEAG